MLLSKTTYEVTRMYCPIPQHCSKRLLSLWRIYSASVLLFILAIGLTAVFTADIAVLIPLSVSVMSVFVYQLLYLPALWENRTYTRSRGILRIEKGVIYKKVTIIPRSQLQFISMHRPLAERILGLSTLVFHTTAGNIRLTGLEYDDAVHLKENFSRRFES